MASLTKTKVIHGVKLKRGSAQPSISTDRTGLKVQEIPPTLCHLTGDALAAPFPPIAPGGYIKYYKIHYDHDELCDVRESTGSVWEMSDSLRDVKRKRRASSASTLLGPLLSHTPKPWPSQETPLKSFLFQIRSPPSPEFTPLPVSPSPPPLSPSSPRRRFLSVIHEASRETMRSDMDETIRSSTTPRKPRVVSYPSSIPTPTKQSSAGPSALTLSLVTPPRSSSSRLLSLVPLSPTGSLRRRRRQLLRTPSVENDFARHAKELLGLPDGYDSPPAISRESSSGSEITHEESLSSPAVSVSTAVTSLMEPQSLPSSPLSPTKPESKENPHTLASPTDNPAEGFIRNDSVTPDPAPPGAFPLPQFKSPVKFGSYQSIGSEVSSSSSSESPTISTPPTSINGHNMTGDKGLHELVLMEETEEDDEDKRDSWASYETAKSSLDSPPPVVADANEPSPEDDLKRELAASIEAFHALVALDN